MTVYFIGLGGFFGAISRFYISKILNTNLGNSLPLGTLLVNVVGCLLMGALMYYATKHDFTKNGIVMFLTVGFLGSFTTFSTFGFETLQLLQASHYKIAILNVIYNVVFGLIAVSIGFFVIKSLDIELGPVQ